MSKSALPSTVGDLVRRYVEIGTAEHDAIERDDTPRFNRLFQQELAVETELKGRPGDGRLALMALYRHPNLQVRLNAAKATLAIAPVAAREVLEEIRATGRQPQAGDAGMCLWTLDEGISKPE